MRCLLGRVLECEVLCVGLQGELVRGGVRPVVQPLGVLGPPAAQQQAAPRPAPARVAVVTDRVGPDQ